MIFKEFSLHSFFLYKNKFYKNIEAQNCQRTMEKLRLRKFLNILIKKECRTIGFSGKVYEILMEWFAPLSCYFGYLQILQTRKSDLLINQKGTSIWRFWGSKNWGAYHSKESRTLFEKNHRKIKEKPQALSPQITCSIHCLFLTLSPLPFRNWRWTARLRWGRTDVGHHHRHYYCFQQRCWLNYLREKTLFLLPTLLRHILSCSNPKSCFLQRKTSRKR